MTETNKNELAEVIVETTENHVVKKLQDGTFRKETIYKQNYSTVPESEEEMIELYKVFNDSGEENENVVTLSKMVGETIGIEQFYTNPYNSFDEKTGLSTNGVTTTIKDGNIYYATSSKSVYHTLNNLVKAFGTPSDPNYRKIHVKVIGTKRQNGVQIDLSLSHLEK